jgi:DNA-binding winged helix-turn-helix (wHTH) protein
MTEPPLSSSPTGEAPLVTVHAPDGAEYAVLDLGSGRVTVGRLADLNDVALQPDPEQLVTRQEHLAFEREGSRWYVVDKGSVNGTFIRRAAELERVDGRAELVDGDIVCVVARLRHEDGTKYWELVFGDRARTRTAGIVPLPLYLTYDPDQARLVLVKGGQRHEITVRPQAHRLVRYMAERNAEAGGTPALCTHQDLMTAVWADEPMHTREELNRLFWELRKKLELFDAQDIFESVRGLGYRMRTSAR